MDLPFVSLHSVSYAWNQERKNGLKQKEAKDTMKTSLLKALFGATATVAGLISMTGNANALSLSRSTLSIGMECNNDMMAMVLGNSSSSQWQYVNDARGDAYGGNHYEFYGMGFMQDATHVYFAINAHDMGLNAGAGRGIGYGDLLINTTGSNLATANGNLFGVRFAPNNSSGVAQVGLYGNVTATSVGGYHVSSQATIDGYLRNQRPTATTAGNFFGSLSSEQGRSYFDPTGFNVIGSGTFLSGIETQTLAQLRSVGYDSSRFQGGQTVAFRIARSSFGPEQSVPEPTTILGLAGIGLALASGKLRKQTAGE